MRVVDSNTLLNSLQDIGCTVKLKVDIAGRVGVRSLDASYERGRILLQEGDYKLLSCYYSTAYNVEPICYKPDKED